jgi:hypothetical protein
MKEVWTVMQGFEANHFYYQPFGPGSKQEPLTAKNYVKFLKLCKNHRSFGKFGDIPREYNYPPVHVTKETSIKVDKMLNKAYKELRVK